MPECGKTLDKSLLIPYNTVVSSRSCPLLSDANSVLRGSKAIFPSEKYATAGGFTRSFLLVKDMGGVSTIAAELLINEEMRDREVRVMGADGAQLGVMPIRQALTLAEEAELDLVKIVPTAQPPVCKLMDYDKHRFEQAKREREMRKNQKERIVSLKEVQLSVTIEENDVAVKAKNAVKFLEGGDKVKVSIRFRGRQIAHSDIGMKVMQDFAERVKDVCTVERRPMIEGRNMIMILAPKAEKASKADKAAKAAKEQAPQA